MKVTLVLITLLVIFFVCYWLIGSPPSHWGKLKPGMSISECERILDDDRRGWGYGRLYTAHWYSTGVDRYVGSECVLELKYWRNTKYDSSTFDDTSSDKDVLEYRNTTELAEYKIHVKRWHTRILKTITGYILD